MSPSAVPLCPCPSQLAPQGILCESRGYSTLSEMGSGWGLGTSPAPHTPGRQIPAPAQQGGAESFLATFSE